jgi:hypothetical protein
MKNVSRPTEYSVEEECSLSTSYHIGDCPMVDVSQALFGRRKRVKMLAF